MKLRVKIEVVYDVDGARPTDEQVREAISNRIASAIGSEELCRPRESLLMPETWRVETYNHPPDCMGLYLDKGPACDTCIVRSKCSAIMTNRELNPERIRL